MSYSRLIVDINAARKPSERLPVILEAANQRMISLRDPVEHIPLTHNTGVYAQSAKHVTLPAFNKFYLLTKCRHICVFSQSCNNALTYEDLLMRLANIDGI